MKNLCPICGEKTRKQIKSYFPDFYLCQSCGGFFARYKKKAKYNEEYFQEKSEPSFLTQLFAPLFDTLLKIKLDYIQSLTRKKSKAKILDYGCGKGKLVENLLKTNLAIGFDPSVGALQLAKRNKLPIYNKIKTVDGGYDLIMFWHSLEHIDQPLKILKSMRKYLNKNGRILIAVPNGDSWEAKLSKTKWFHYSFPLHVIQFTPSSLEIILKRSGYKIEKIDFFNPEYTLSGLVQSFLNLFLPQDVLYSVVTHRRLSMSSTKARLFSIVSLIILVIFSPIIILFFIIELIFHKTNAMLLIAKK